MPRFEKTDIKPDTAQTAKEMPPLDWLGANFVNPLVNTVCVEPINALAWTLDESTGQKDKHRLEPLPVPTEFANSGSKEMVCQSVAMGLGSVIPYALAGRFTGNTMRFAGATFKAEGALAKFAQSEKAAQIIGSGLYDGMKETRNGETHLLNGTAGAANFAVLTYWRANPTSKTVVSRGIDRFIAGMSGTLVHTAVARPDALAVNSPAQGIDVGRQMLAGGLMNALLPGTQEGIRRLQDKVAVRMGAGIPIDRYVKTGDFARWSFSVKGESRLLEQNTWARIQPNAQFSSYEHGRDMVTLKEGSTKKTFLHELQHRKEALTGIAEPGFVRAANLLKQDTDRAWDVYKSVRQAQEIRAELASRHDEAIPRYCEAIKDLKKTLPLSSATGGVPYMTIWREEFKEFMRTRGKYRPDSDYAARNVDHELESEANKLHFRLSDKQKHADKAISGVIGRPDLNKEQVTSVFRHINEFLDPREPHPTPLPLDRLAMQALRLTAKPEKVAQGRHPTCTPAAVEYITYVKHPENAANLISQVVRDNKYKCADGTSILVSGLNVVPERYWDRPFANQLFQNTAVNVHWQRKGCLGPWMPRNHPDFNVEKGKVLYQRQLTSQLQESPYRLVDFAKNPPQHIYDRLPKALKDDPADPLMNHDAAGDINRQINGSAGGAVALPWRLDSQNHLLTLLHQRHERGDMPVMTVVDSRHALFSDGLSDPAAGGWHSIVISSFDPIQKVVSLFNPWGKVLHGVSIKQVFDANREFKMPTADKSL